MNRFFSLVPVMIFLVIPSVCFAWQGKVTALSSGDTATVLHDGKKEQVRIYGVECPAKDQDFFRNAKDFSASLVLNKVVEFTPLEKDRYARPVGVMVADGKNLGRELVKAGLAWFHSQTCKHPECREWMELEKQAKLSGVGIWSVQNPVPPWEFKSGKYHGAIYSGDIVTHKFHSTNCPEFSCRSCIATFRGRAKAIAAGYSPCASCNP